MTVFWTKGYEGASLSDLTEAMGINRPSLYAAYGNKQELFRKALERYGEGPSSYEREALAQPTAREVAEGLLRGAADVQTDPNTPAGCLATLGTTYCADDSSPVGKMLIASRLAGHAAIRERLERARAEGDLPARRRSHSADPLHRDRRLRHGRPRRIRRNTRQSSNASSSSPCAPGRSDDARPAFGLPDRSIAAMHPSAARPCL